MYIMYIQKYRGDILEDLAKCIIYSFKTVEVSYFANYAKFMLPLKRKVTFYFLT